MSPVDRSADTKRVTMTDEDFERHARELLEDSVLRVDGRIRSRLNQARHAAIAAAAGGRRSGWGRLWSRFALMPAAGAVAAAVLVAFVLWPHSPSGPQPGESGRASVEDLDLLADGEALDLVSEGSDGSFYEWAVDQSAPEGPVETSS